MTSYDAPLRGPFHDWYETWRAQQADRREAAEKERRGHERDDRRIAMLLIAYMVTGGALAALAVALVMAH
ncbi:hypothetical protein [Lichenibacterium dinghuense]|uniref:hypothetical protein n=1 Tax=Lichenibacterium dinghuense TaxID=2895977 RepID=UPI001F15E52E|nr:hypothetical protein [Lichenibacterium sp. 6Y81]